MPGSPPSSNEILSGEEFVGRCDIPPAVQSVLALGDVRSADVSQAFGRTYEKCHEIQRDQFLLPYYLWHANLSFDTEAFPMTFLADSVGMCMVNTREGRN